MAARIQEPKLVTYRVKSNTIPHIIEELDLVMRKNTDVKREFNQYFTELYGPKVKVKVSRFTKTVSVEYDF